MTFLEKLAIDLPIIQAPMAGVSTPTLAAAVSNSGALGSIAVGNVNADAARDMIRDTRALTKRSLNVNVFCHEPAKKNPQLEQAWLERFRPEFTAFGATPPNALGEIYKTFLEDDDMLTMLLSEKPRGVSFHFGVPSDERVRALRDAGILLFGSATSVREARLLAAAGVHAIVAQGWEAGGHRGAFAADDDDELGTVALVRVLVRSIDLPVIAAGGIMDGAGIASMLKLGAVAAQLGTAFVACPESQADTGYRAALVTDAAHHTTMTRAISGRPARCLQNKFTKIGERISTREIPAYPLAYDLGKSLNAAAKTKGEFGFGAQWAGQGAPLSRALPAAELVRLLAEELRSAASEKASPPST